MRKIALAFKSHFAAVSRADGTAAGGVGSMAGRLYLDSKTWIVYQDISGVMTPQMGDTSD